MFISLIKSSQL